VLCCAPFFFGETPFLLPPSATKGFVALLRENAVILFKALRFF